MTLYLDVLIVVNFLADYLLLRITAKVMAHPLKRLRFVLTAAAGALYAGAACMPWGAFLNRMPVRILVGCLMGVGAFGWNRACIRKTIVFFLLSCLLGGVAFALSFVSNGSVGLYRGAFYIHTSLPAMLLTFAGVYALVTVVSSVTGRRFRAQKDIHEAAAVLASKTASFQVLADTGCMVSDPLTAKPVMVVAIDGIAPILPQELVDAIQAGEDAAEMIQSFSKPGRRIRPVFCRGVGGTPEMLICFQPDALTVDGKPCSAALAISRSGLDASEGFQAVVHPDALELG